MMSKKYRSKKKKEKNSCDYLDYRREYQKPVEKHKIHHIAKLLLRMHLMIRAGEIPDLNGVYHEPKDCGEEYINHVITCLNSSKQFNEENMSAFEERKQRFDSVEKHDGDGKS